MTMENKTFTLSYALSLVTTLAKNFVDPEIIMSVIKWGQTLLKAAELWGDASPQFQAIAKNIQTLKDNGWKLEEVLTTYDVTISEMEADFAVLEGPGVTKTPTPDDPSTSDDPSDPQLVDMDVTLSGKSKKSKKS